MIADEKIERIAEAIAGKREEKIPATILKDLQMMGTRKTKDRNRVLEKIWRNN